MSDRSFCGFGASLLKLLTTWRRLRTLRRAIERCRMSKKFVGCVCTICNVPFRDEIETEMPPAVHSISSFADLNTRIYKMKCFDCLTKHLASCFGEWLGRFAAQRSQQRKDKRHIKKAQKGKGADQALTVLQCFKVLDAMDEKANRAQALIDDKLRQVAEAVDAAG